ncbi:hypothetical protein AB4Y72_16510 [Arthrobacter sp. YAF34]|uniref:hypothetical protein n=1 Tax=Arthrobacter sp. YAF34 TaxID=3233083 RepID=UPI003F936846
MGDDQPAERGNGLGTGARLTQLILGSQSWVHRRVDSLTLGVEGETSRSVSLDVTVPADWAISGSKGRMIVPLALIEKATLRRVSTRDASGHPMPVLGTAANSELAAMFLNQITPEWIRANAATRAECSAHIHQLVDATPDEAEATARAFDSWLNRIVEGRNPGDNDRQDVEVFNRFARHLASHFLFLVEMDSTLRGTRTVLKFSHDLDAPLAGGTRTAVIQTEVPDFGFTASQHMEVIVPPGLAIRAVRMVELNPDGSPLDRDSDRPKPKFARPVGHVSIAPMSRMSSGRLVVDVVPARRGIQNFTRASAALVSAALFLALLLKFDMVAALTPDAKIPSPSASILLIGPALLLSWLGRTPEHDLTATLLGPLRMILLLLSFVLLLMATAAAIPMTPLFWNILWWTAAVVDAVALLWLIHYDEILKRAMFLFKVFGVLIEVIRMPLLFPK